MCFPFPISVNFLGHRSAIWRLFHLKMIFLIKGVVRSSAGWTRRMPAGRTPLFAHRRTITCLSASCQTATCRLRPGKPVSPRGQCHARSRVNGRKQRLFSLLVHSWEERSENEDEGPVSRKAKWEESAGASSHASRLASLRLARPMENEEAFE